MKFFLVTILLVVFAAQSFGNVWLWVDYKINLEKYAKNCINKARPMLKCNGKCQLAKKIQEEETKKQKEAEKAAPKIDYSLSSKHFFPAIHHVALIVPRYFYIQGSATEIKMPRSVFRPPCA
ncbi:hypothetical protein [Niabella hibiscisoli]|uniref:hypothetical protein n=1 Tax=Niabella hibiscisoli TaxID=1825928 RepID=UPI001F0DFF34|nr:hypothetical protein [Niabella hibiscisoli]MCH5718517.1 hypothetical protein [Niabella hibiscisoli]